MDAAKAVHPGGADDALARPDPDQQAEKLQEAEETPGAADASQAAQGGTAETEADTGTQSGTDGSQRAR